MTFRGYPFSSVFEGMRTILGGLLTLVLGGALGIAAGNFCLHGLDVDPSTAWVPFQGSEITAPAVPEIGSTGREPVLENLETAIQSWVIVYCVYSVIAAFFFYGMFWKDWPRLPVFPVVAALHLTLVLVQSHGFRFETIGITVRIAVCYMALLAFFLAWLISYRRRTAASEMTYLRENSEVMKKF